jgi:hypothetical protein
MKEDLEWNELSQMIGVSFEQALVLRRANVHEGIA